MLNLSVTLTNEAIVLQNEAIVLLQELKSSQVDTFGD